MNDSTPVIIGVGEASERVDAPDYRALSPADLAGLAAAAALDDALDRATLVPQISFIATIRQFEVSGPNSVVPTTFRARLRAASAPTRHGPFSSPSATRGRSTS